MLDSEKDEAEKRAVLLKENAVLKHRIEQAEVRNSTLRAELQILQGEIRAFSQKAADVKGDVVSRKVLDKGLITTLDEQSDIKRDLDGEKFRHETLNEQIPLLEEQLQMFQNKKVDNKVIIACLTAQNEHLKKKIENEKLMKHQAMLKFLEEMKNIRNDHAEKYEQMKKLEVELEKKYEAIQDALEKFQQTQKETEEDKEDEDLDVIEIARTLGTKSEAEDEEQETVAEDSVEKETNAEEGLEKEDANDMRNEIKRTLVDIVKYQALCDAAVMESEHLQQLIVVFGKRTEEMNATLETSKKMYFEVQKEVKEMESKIEKLKAAIAAKKSRKIWNKSSAAAAAADAAWPEKTEIEQLHIDAALVKEENDMLRKFLDSTLEVKEEEYRLYSTIANKLEKHLEKNVENIKEIFGITDEDVENEGEDEEDDEKEEKASEEQTK